MGLGHSDRIGFVPSGKELVVVNDCYWIGPNGAMMKWDGHEMRTVAYQVMGYDYGSDDGDYTIWGEYKDGKLTILKQTTSLSGGIK